MLRADLLQDDVTVQYTFDVITRIPTENIDIIFFHNLMAELLNLNCRRSLSLFPEYLHALSEDRNAPTRFHGFCRFTYEAAKRAHKPTRIDHIVDHKVGKRVNHLYRYIPALLNGHIYMQTVCL